MAVEDIVKRIRDDAKAEAKRIKKDAAAESARTKAEAEDEAARVAEAVRARSEAQAVEEERRILSAARLEARNTGLNARRQGLEAVFEEVERRLAGLPDDTYRALITRLLATASETGDEEVILSPEQAERLGPELVAAGNRALADEGRRGELTLSGEVRPMAGGFVLRRGAVEINSSFAALITGAREDLEPEVLKILSGEAK